MVRERRRLLIPPARLGQWIALTTPEHHYLTRVLRLAVGQGCDVVDGAGHRWSARLAAGGSLELEQPLTAPLEAQPPLAPGLELAVALPRQEVEVVWRMATELGIDRLQPLLAERCQVRERWPLDRWRTILREACEQCERLWLPELAEPAAAAAWLAAVGGPDREAVSGAVGEDPSPTCPGEEAWRAESERGLNCGGEPAPANGWAGRSRDLNLLASSRGAHLPLLSHVLQATRAATAPGPGQAPARVRLAIGPEGGWSPAEEETARARGWIPVSAGANILRTTTAAAAAAAWLSLWRATLSSSSSPWPSP